MIGRVRIAVCFVLLMTASTGAAAAAVLDQRAADRGEDQQRTFSPLHDFLGIDPETGRFVDPQSTPASQSDRKRLQEADTSANASGDPPTKPPTGSRQPAPDDLPRDAEEATEALRRITERFNEGSLDEFSSLVGRRISNDRLSDLSRRFAWLTAGLLLLYPLSILLSESLGWWFRRDEAGLSDLDRRYWRTRLRRRLLLASTLIGLIVIATIGSVNAYWWNQPELFTLFCIAIGLLGIAAATLSSMIRQSAKHYSLTLMRQMRREQLEIRADLDELCKRMRQVTMTSD